MWSLLWSPETEGDQEKAAEGDTIHEDKVLVGETEGKVKVPRLFWKELDYKIMEALTESLVGKDEVFIVEKLHCMLRNEEKVKVQEDIIT